MTPKEPINKKKQSFVKTNYYIHGNLYIQKKLPDFISEIGESKTAATYSPACAVPSA